MSGPTVISASSPPESGESTAGNLRLHLWVLVITLAAEAIGNHSFSIGKGKIVLFPMLYALVMGSLVGIAGKRLPDSMRVGKQMQFRASAMVQVAVLLLVAKLALVVGAKLPELMQSGRALAFQEVGHFMGTVLFAMPIALLLGVKREAVGATFSIGREASLAIIAEKYGMSSPEGRGVLAEYVTGTVIGGLYIAILASVVKSLGILDPVALAMGAGVGSTSMMAVAAGAIKEGLPKAVQADVVAFAAASNLITTTLGTYVTLFVSLPFANVVYRVLEPVLSPRRTRGNLSVSGDKPDRGPVSDTLAPVRVTWGFKLGCIVATALVTLFAGVVHGAFPDWAPVGMVVIVVVTVIGEGISRLIPVKVPVVCWVAAIGMLATAPLGPWALPVDGITGAVDAMALATPILAYAGLSLAKDIPAFRHLGWRIVVTSLLASTGTFLFAAIIGQLFMKR